MIDRVYTLTLWRHGTACMSALLSPTPPHMFSVCDTHCRSEWLYGCTYRVSTGSCTGCGPARTRSPIQALSLIEPLSVPLCGTPRREAISVTSISLQLTHTRPKEEEEENQSASCCVPCLHVWQEFHLCGGSSRQPAHPRPAAGTHTWAAGRTAYAFTPLAVSKRVVHCAATEAPRKESVRSS